MIPTKTKDFDSDKKKQKYYNNSACDSTDDRSPNNLERECNFQIHF